MLDIASSTQIFSMVFGSVLVALVGAAVRSMSEISNSIRSLNEKMAQVLTKISYHDSSILDQEARLRRLEQSDGETSSAA